MKENKMALTKTIIAKRKELVDKIVADIESGKPFFWDKGHYGKKPRNLLKALNGEDKFYKGINAMQLTVSAKANGFTDSRWATFKQALMAGGHIKKGAKGTPIEYWQYTKEIFEIDPSTGKKEKKEVMLKQPIVRSYIVFNAEQIEGIKEEQFPTITQEDKNKYMENMIKNSEAKIFYDESSQNYYSVSKDEIHVLPREKFKNLDFFYATVAHEIAHSTGAEQRLNRETVKNNDGYGNEIYAKEELRAELTSMFLQQRYNVKFDKTHYENHTAYLKSWARVIKNDPNEIYRAAADAEKALSYIETRMIQKNFVKDKEVTHEQITQKKIPKQKITITLNTEKTKTKTKSLQRG